MKLIRCERGHYYDSQQHTRCPSCGVTGLAVQNNDQAQSAKTQPEAMLTQVRGQASGVADVGVTVAMVRKKNRYRPGCRLVSLH
jgi:hypothetical protein